MARTTHFLHVIELLCFLQVGPNSFQTRPERSQIVLVVSLLVGRILLAACSSAYLFKHQHGTIVVVLQVLTSCLIGKVAIKYKVARRAILHFVQDPGALRTSDRDVVMQAEKDGEHCQLCRLHEAVRVLTVGAPACFGGRLMSAPPARRSRCLPLWFVARVEPLELRYRSTFYWQMK
jgi:hypothetical protein